MPIDGKIPLSKKVSVAIIFLLRPSLIVLVWLTTDGTRRNIEMTSTTIDPVFRMERDRLLSNCVCMRTLAKRDSYWLDCVKDRQRKLAAFRTAWAGFNKR